MLTAAILYNIGFGVFHLLFWRIFDWPESLKASGLVNGGITQILNLCLTFVFFAAAAAMAALDSASQADNAFLLTAGAFWAFRAALQPIFFPLGHRASAGLFAVFIAGSLIHFAAAV